MEKIIKKLSELRQGFIDNYENSWDEEQAKHTILFPKEADTIGDRILDLLKLHHADLPVEFVIEELTKLGQAPSILYDDNGHFAITSDGIQSISVEPDDCEMYFYASKNMWKPTIRKALEYYLMHDDSEDVKPSTQEELWNKIQNNERDE